jgi:mono/diheme cytochrome c family protein
MTRTFGKSICVCAALLFGLLMAAADAAEPSAEQLEFFESKVRPVFAEQCYKCHSEKAEKLKGGLRLDSPEAILKGGDTGPAIVPGDIEGSLLIKAVRYSDPDLQMPPKNKKLSTEQIASLEAWVKMGAPMPLTPTLSPSDGERGKKARAKHWAFQPVKKPAVPAVKNSRWVQTPVDNFVLATLEKRNLSPAPSADQRTLIRRVTYDLTGLPPTYEEVEAFSCDQSPDSYARLVERLLASPHYGERWARYWLDVARYADTKGYLAGGEERRYAFSYTYRDYVVRAFNDDKPYDHFLIEQIAADKLQLGEDKRSLAALGFLTLGRRFLNNQNDIIDDRIDVVSRGTLGLTVACARCHDHKFDPIPTKDYYALHGVFASSEEPGELPLLGPLKDSPDYQDYLKQKAKIETESEEYELKEIAQFISELRQHVGEYLLAAHEAGQLKDQSKFDTFAGERKVNPAVLRRWMSELDARSKKPDPIFQPWFELAKLPEADFATNAKPIAAKWPAEQPSINPIVLKTLPADALNSLKVVADAYTKLFKDIDAEWKSALESAKKATNAAPTSFADADREALRQFLYAEGTPLVLPRAEAETLLARKLGEGTAPFRNRIEALNWTHPGAPARAMALVDRPNPGNSHVLKRGNPSNPGEEAPRHFLEVLSATNPAPLTNGSGRLELARAIASPENPLTARVYVNRIWLHHFGEGLVNTPGDFGVRTEEPVYRALLDYLATTFVEQGWSTKALHRMILLSATYQQSSEAQPAELKADPDNRLLTHVNRQRLDFEALRDTLLELSGKLDLKVGGLPVEIDTEPFATRRTLYGLIDRQNLPAVFRTFDFANPDVSNQGRFHTTVPQQALFLMNSPFVIEQAKGVARRPEIAKAGNAEEKIQALYRLILQRAPQKAELELGEKFIAQKPDSKLSPLEKYAQVLLLSNELSYVD